MYSASVWQNLPMEDSSNPHETNICQKKTSMVTFCKKSLTLQKVEFLKYLWREIGSLCLVQFPSNLAPAILFQSLTTWRGKREESHFPYFAVHAGLDLPIRHVYLSTGWNILIKEIGFWLYTKSAI